MAKVQLFCGHKRFLFFFFLIQFNAGGTPKVTEDYKYNNK